MNAIFLKAQMRCMEAGEFLKGRPMRVLRRLAGDERAVSVIEYAILLGVIVGVVAVAATQFGDQIAVAINTVAGRVSNTVTNVGTS